MYKEQYQDKLIKENKYKLLLPSGSTSGKYTKY